MSNRDKTKGDLTKTETYQGMSLLSFIKAADATYQERAVRDAEEQKKEDEIKRKAESERQYQLAEAKRKARIEKKRLKRKS